jgi:glycosyltransferase involved in cell wall biosynthesis
MNNIKEPFVSVVTPVYNGEAFISECIKSVLAQTYQNYEYLIVNNCSTDRTVEIINQYASLDSRIQVHHNDVFLTSLQNQNHAMTFISPKSKYCKVVHADDWLYPECIKKMVKAAETDATIGIVGSFMLQGSFVNCDGLPPPSGESGEQYPVGFFTGRDICRFDILNSKTNIFGNPTTLLIRSDLINDNNEPFYDERHIFMDIDACYRVLQKCNFAFIYQVLSYERKHEGQIHSIMVKNQFFIASQFYILNKYGRSYLEKSEFNALQRDKLIKYHSFLKYNSLRKINFRKDREFWNYHLLYMKLSGFPVRNLKLILWAFLELSDILFNPKRAFAIIIRRIKNLRL